MGFVRLAPGNAGAASWRVLRATAVDSGIMDAAAPAAMKFLRLLGMMLDSSPG